MQDEQGVSEVIGFLMTFSIVAGLLLVSMLAFNDAQARAENRVADIQGSSAAQRVAAAAIEIALAGPSATTVSVAVDLPDSIAGTGYLVKLCQTSTACGDIGPGCTACPYVLVESKAGFQRQATFLTAGAEFFGEVTCGGLVPVANAGLVYLTYNSGSKCIGLSNSPV